MVLTEGQKKIRNLKQQVQDKDNRLNDIRNQLQIKKDICKYQENLINKLLNTIQKKEIDINNDLEKGYD